MKTMKTMKTMKIVIIFISVLLLLRCDNGRKFNADLILEQRPDNTTCIAGKALPTAGIAVDFLNLELPVTIEEGSITALKQNTQVDNAWYVVKQKGLIYKLDSLSSESNSHVYLDLQDQVFDETSNEQGLVGLAFHPDFENFPHAFVFYTAASATALSGSEVRLSRFVEEAGELNLASEEILIRYDKNAPYHHAGTLEMGPDTYLYLSIGDDVLNGEWNQNNNAPNPFSIKGKILRIDVSGASGYSIPESNPYVSAEFGAPEVFALGLRNPWKFTFDVNTNALWAGDVGRVGAEEINKIESNQHYGWPIMEGNRCYQPAVCENETLIRPVVSFNRNDKRCIIGGYVYRGSDIAALQGQYFSGDCVFGGIWLSDVYGEKVNGSVQSQLLLATQENITSFAEDEQKELYFATATGKVFKLVAANEEQQIFTMQEKLSDTTCVNMNKPNQASKHTVAYRIRFPFWSDNSDKNRFFALPNETVIEDFVKHNESYYQPYTYQLPTGTVLIKNFSVNGKIIETRLLAQHSENNWQGYSYEWNETQSEALLLSDSKLKTLDDDSQYYFPSRTDCLTCHTHAAHRVLGFNPYQLNLTLSNGVAEEHQLTYLKRLGIDLSPTTITAESFASAHEKNTTEWVKSYLHTNCSFCHQEGASLDLDMDLRFTQSLTQLHNQNPTVDDFGIEQAKIIAPKHPERSILLNRVTRKDENRMPFIGNFLSDEQAIEKLTDYINSL